MGRDARRSRVLLGVLLAASAVLVAVDRAATDGSPLASWRATAGEVAGPLQAATTAVTRPVRAAAERLGALGEDGKRIASLEAENAALRLQLRSLAATRGRVESYEAALRLAAAGGYRVVPAQVVGAGTAQGFARTVTIDAGSLDGITPDLTVVAGDGLVGRVKAVSRTTATVVLAVDPTSQVGIRLEGDVRAGLVAGRGDGLLALELLDSQAQVAAGDRLVTYGSRGGVPFVAGVPVGEVVEVAVTPGARTRSATVAPYVDFAALDVVGVVVEPPRTDPRDSVLPPRPASR